MKKLLSVIVAAAFAAVSLNVLAQKEDVKTKQGTNVGTKTSGDVTTKDVKEKPKAAPKPKKEKPQAAKPKEPGTNVKTKSGGPVTNKKGEDVTTKGK